LQLDSFLVGLISVAVAIPVTLFMQSCFEIANDNEAPMVRARAFCAQHSPPRPALSSRSRAPLPAHTTRAPPQSWLKWTGIVRKLLWGFSAHRKWHYMRDKPPRRYVKWYVRCCDEPTHETLQNAWDRFTAWRTGGVPSWITEAREAEEAAAAEAVDETLDETLEAAMARSSGASSAPSSAAASAPGGSDAGGSHKSGSGAGSGAGSTSSSLESARALRTFKRLVMSAGLVGVYVCWAIFAWFIFVYGALIYNLQGEGVEASFARSWGVSYGISSAAEWQQIVVAALKGALVLAILERLCLTRPLQWLEEAVDYYSLHALLLSDPSAGLTGAIRTFYSHTKRLED
jgi:hypothetical protein